MNGLNYLLDTNIIIGLLKGNHESISALNGVELTNCGYSAITRMELLSYSNLTQNEVHLIENLLTRMAYLAISPKVEDTTIQFRQQYQVKLPDAIIAATAIVHNIQLLTLDKKLAAKL